MKHLPNFFAYLCISYCYLFYALFYSDETIIHLSLALSYVIIAISEWKKNVG